MWFVNSLKSIFKLGSSFCLQYISSNVFSVKDAELLKQVVTDHVKIPSFESRNIDLIKYCTDNAAMICMAGYEKLINKQFSDITLDISPNLLMSE